MSEREELTDAERAWATRDTALIGKLLRLYGAALDRAKAGEHNQVVWIADAKRRLAAESRLSDAIALLQWLDRKGGLGLDTHERIRAVLSATPAPATPPPCPACWRTYGHPTTCPRWFVWYQEQHRDPRPAPAAPTNPVPMQLDCPKCGTHHVDELDDAGIDWATRPHKTHLCLHCGELFKPRDYATVGTPAPAAESAPCFGCGLESRAEPSVRGRADGKARCNSCESSRRGTPGICGDTPAAESEPTIEHAALRDWFNALPEPFRGYVHWLDTNADPSWNIRDAVCWKENALACGARIAELEHELAAAGMRAEQNLQDAKELDRKFLSEWRTRVASERELAAAQTDRDFFDAERIKECEANDALRAAIDAAVLELTRYADHEVSDAPINALSDLRAAQKAAQ